MRERRPRDAAPPPRSYGAAADRALDLWVALARCYSSLHRHSARDIHRHGLTQAQFAVLEVLYHKGPMPLRMVGQKLLVTGGNVTFVVNELERSGLLRRQRSDRDRRVVLAKLTPKGGALMERVFPAHAACVEAAALPLTAREQATLARLLKRWGKAVQAR